MLECREGPRMPRKTKWEPVLKHSTRKGFAASPIDTATAPESLATRDETCWSIKTSISCETSSNFTLRSVKGNVFLRVFLWTYRKIDVSRLLSIFITGHKMPPLPRNLHVATTSRSADNAIRRKHETWHVQSAAPATQDDIGPKCCACHEKDNALSGENVAKVLRLPKKLLTRHEACWSVTKCHTCHATWSYATLETSRSDPFCRTYHRHGHTALTRTVADGCGGCERLLTVANGRATSGEHSSTPTPPEWNGNPCYAFGEKRFIFVVHILQRPFKTFLWSYRQRNRTAPVQ